MTDIRDKMKAVIQSGIDGYLDAAFSGQNAPKDAVTGYPLFRDSVEVIYRSQIPYQQIEDEFMEGLAAPPKASSKFFQAWSNYHWNYAHLELVERFEIVRIELTEEMLERREQARQSMLSEWRGLIAQFDR